MPRTDPTTIPETDLRRMTKAERREAGLFFDALQMIEYDLFSHAQARSVVPKEWHQIAADPSQQKQRITLRLDADIVTYFRAMGSGYQARINRVLSAWMHGRLARMIEGPDTVDIGFRRAQLSETRTEWGDNAEQMGRVTVALEAARQREIVEEMREMVRASDAADGR
ncbi:BrnA antitoxin of type II toxin-antitoxin system [Tranquillimonas rosea]|uniref:BrnA antitoxin of type II toxin-antitoxin system n=1 Tax=Tranquillimonas rosea TaxID=641238 RepID=A0A1H9RLQ9_9RHOB|nr:BrnA antitoxin family protein [Tranquillimonas rosea]SER73690.1 BrnA antitoxin of type II toxin-antitoxin system [Tranquillimonas rosea]